jgi:hypothetical protein
MTRITTTNFTTRMMIAAATLVAAAGTVSAQGLKAEIPFAFRAGSRVMAAGTYQVKIDTLKNGQPMFRIRNADGGASVLMAGTTARDPKKAWVETGRPVLSFTCGTSRCALAEIWSGPDQYSYAVPTPKLGRDEPTHIAIVLMRHQSGE